MKIVTHPNLDMLINISVEGSSWFIHGCVLKFKAKSRRQPKPYKPKKMMKLDSKTAVYTACNNGSSSIITKEGELYMFGKDAIYSDSTCK